MRSMSAFLRSRRDEVGLVCAAPAGCSLATRAAPASDNMCLLENCMHWFPQTLQCIARRTWPLQPVNQARHVAGAETVIDVDYGHVAGATVEHAQQGG